MDKTTLSPNKQRTQTHVHVQSLWYRGPDHGRWHGMSRQTRPLCEKAAGLEIINEICCIRKVNLRSIKFVFRGFPFQF